jgi:hypothetical protein
VAEPLSPEEFAVSFRRFLDAMHGAVVPSPFAERLTAHLGCDVRTVPVLSEEFASYEHPTLQRALDFVLSRPGRTYERIGLAGQNKRFMNMSLSDLLSGPELVEGPVDWVNVHLAGGEVLPCLQFGLFLVTDDMTDGAEQAGTRSHEDQHRYAVFVAGPTNDNPGGSLRVEVGAPQQADAEALLARLRSEMERLDVYRGQVLSLSTGHIFGPRGPNTILTFHERPEVERDEVILPDGVLDRIERHTVVFSAHGEALLAAGRSLRRGILVHGPPGTGKTLTARYLCSRLGGRTVLLLTGAAIGGLAEVSSLARRLAPSMVVLEDVDLIAEERTMPWRGAPPSFLFELLNEMDGLRDDADVIYLLTTNRAELLEPALALRPGRVDLSVELPLPDADGRLRLLKLYARGLDASEVDWEPYVVKTEGVSPAYIKELLRQAALRAAEAGRPGQVAASDMDGALVDLAAGGDFAQRLLGAAAARQRDATSGSLTSRRPASAQPGTYG